MFCLMCEKYLCNLHYLDENRIHYSYHRNDKSAYLKSYRSMIQKSLRNINSCTVINLIDEFNGNIDKKRINCRKIDLLVNKHEESIKNSVNTKVEVFDSNFYKACSLECYINKFQLNNNLDSVSKLEHITEEYIQKLFLIYMFDFCSILVSLKNTLGNKVAEVTCFDVS